jgi:hypothetical protein
MWRNQGVGGVSPSRAGLTRGAINTYLVHAVGPTEAVKTPGGPSDKLHGRGLGSNIARTKFVAGATRLVYYFYSASRKPLVQFYKSGAHSGQKAASLASEPSQQHP